MADGWAPLRLTAASIGSSFLFDRVAIRCFRGRPVAVPITAPKVHSLDATLVLTGDTDWFARIEQARLWVRHHFARRRRSGW